MAKQAETVLNGLKGAIDEGAGKIKETAKTAVDAAKDVKQDAEKKAKTAAKTVRRTAAKTAAKAEKAETAAEKEIAKEEKKAEKVVKRTAKKAEKAGKAVVSRGQKAAKAVEKKIERAAKKPVISKNLKSKVVFQFYGNNADADDVLKKAQKAAQKVCSDRAVKTLEVYINGHENAAYYVVNGKADPSYRIDL